MKERSVIFSPEARDDLVQIAEWITDAAGPIRALAYIDRLEAFCGKLELASERGSLREDIRPGLRIIGFERRITIAFAVDEASVTILRMFYGGRDWQPELS